jgi:predicted molibdopterin-dependent oxidoreductase YjgC
MGNNWPYADERAITREISVTIPLYKGLDWDALGDQGQQYDAGSVRPAPQLREIKQADAPGSSDQGLILVSGTVTYDDGNMFRLTPQMRNMAFGRAAGISPSDAAKLGIEEGTPLVVQNERGQLTLAAKISEQVLPGTLWIPESLAGAPVGNLLNDAAVTTVTVKVAVSEMAVAA